MTGSNRPTIARPEYRNRSERSGFRTVLRRSFENLRFSDDGLSAPFVDTGVFYAHHDTGSR